MGGDNSGNVSVLKDFHRVQTLRRVHDLCIVEARGPESLEVSPGDGRGGHLRWPWFGRHAVVSCRRSTRPEGGTVSGAPDRYSLAVLIVP
jgi:hypothetical protein